MNPPDFDARDLVGFRYARQLRRTLGGFPNFAVFTRL